MNGQNIKRSSRPGAIRKLLFTGILVILSFLIIETGIRGVLALKLGSRVFLYGTSFYRNTPTVPSSSEIQLLGEVNAHRKGAHSAVGNTDLQVGTASAGYTKYFPNEPKIDFDENGQKFEVSINSHGFRGKDFSSNKEPSVVRIVTLGASSTFGYYDRDDETYPYLLEEELNRSRKDSQFEVINLGIPHLTSEQILELFQREALPLNPDVVTFYEGINDSSYMPDEAWQTKLQDEQPGSTLQNLRRSLKSLLFLRDMYTAARDRLVVIGLIESLLVSDAITYNREDVERHIHGKIPRFRANLSALRNLCRERGILFIVMTQQARSMAIGTVKDMTYDEEIAAIRGKLNATNRITHQEKTFLTHKMLMDDLRSWARAERVSLVDIIELLDKDRDVLLSWVHVSPRGNRMIANALSKAILEELRMTDGGSKL